MTENMHIARLVFELDDLSDEVQKIAEEHDLQELAKVSETIKNTVTKLSKELADIVK
ncbi:TPA: hypothetical protein U1C26_002047 [Streptococcus suis]|nr:hypothetical protein [Streptococcus suis]